MRTAPEWSRFRWSRAATRSWWTRPPAGSWRPGRHVGPVAAEVEPVLHRLPPDLLNGHADLQHVLEPHRPLEVAPDGDAREPEAAVAIAPRHRQAAGVQ